MTTSQPQLQAEGILFIDKRLARSHDKKALQLHLDSRLGRFHTSPERYYHPVRPQTHPQAELATVQQPVNEGIRRIRYYTGPSRDRHFLRLPRRNQGRDYHTWPNPDVPIIEVVPGEIAW